MTAQAFAQAVRRIWQRHSRGYGFLAARSDSRWIERCFPIDGDIEEFFTKYWYRRYDLYFCPNTFSRNRRLGMHALATPFAHCDIDGADPALFEPPPTLLTETSPGRYQGIWEFETTVEPKVAESVSRGLTREYGGDPGGWSITKMLRIPGSMNHKDMYDLPVVSVVRDLRTPIAIWPESTKARVALTSLIAAPAAGGLCPSEKLTRDPADYDAALERFRAALKKSEPLASRKMWLNMRVCQTKDRVFEHGIDRSHILRQIILRLKALGLTEGETFTLAWRSGWCKFRVDNRREGEERLWHEIAKAYGRRLDREVAEVKI